jgi:hypothetical protein
VEKVDTSQVIAIYRRGIIVPLFMVTGVIVLLLIMVGADEPGTGAFALTLRIVFSNGVGMRRL